MNSYFFFIYNAVSCGEKSVLCEVSYNKLGGKMLSPKFENGDVAIEMTSGKEWLGDLA